MSVHPGTELKISSERDHKTQKATENKQHITPLDDNKTGHGRSVCVCVGGDETFLEFNENRNKISEPKGCDQSDSKMLSIHLQMPI